MTAFHTLTEPCGVPGRERQSPRPTALVVDDQRRIRAAIARGLHRHGFDVIEAADGHAALVAAAGRQLHVALVDLSLPIIDGFRVVEQLKTRYGTSLPVLVVSGTGEPDARLRAFDAGADDFVAKPIDIPELIKRVDAFERARRAYRDLALAKERAEHLRLYAVEAAALLAHDLNNGLCVAVSNLEYLRSLHCLGGDPADALAASLRSVGRMAGLVRNFVDITRLEDASLIAQRAPADVCDMIAGAAAIHDPEARHRGARLQVSCEGVGEACIDRSLIERVIHNLLGNAVRYTNPGGRIRIAARREAAGDPDRRRWLVVEVGNTGPGIPDAVRSRLFEKYATGRDRNARRGMGLYFCRLACEAHGGSIALVPDGNYRANFVIRLPLEQA